jgi:hypothetical protein
MKAGPALRKIGQLEAKFTDAKAPATKPATPAKAESAKPAAVVTEISRAPAPISPLKSGTPVAEVPIDAQGVYYGDFPTYKRLREAGKIK